MIATFAENGDQGENEKHVLARACAPVGRYEVRGESFSHMLHTQPPLTVPSERALQLHAPLGLRAVHLEDTHTHSEDDERRNELENP